MSLLTTPQENLSWVSGLLLKRARPIGHVVFWLVVLSFYTLYFGFRQVNYNQSLVFIGLLLPITIITTYFLLYWLIPKYLLNQRYFLFTLYFLYTLLFSLYLELLLVLLLYINISDYQNMFVKPGLIDLLDVLVGMYLVVFLAVAINLLKRWLYIQSKHAALETKRIETELKLKDAELQLLKSQIHPHFLFNTLNNLYALALDGSERVPDIVLKISQQLDYMLYRSDQSDVPVRDEISHIQNYLALEALRYDAERVKVHMEVSGNPDKHQIAPLLLIPFIENSFKHGVSQSKDPGWIDISINIKDSLLEFSINNSKGAAKSTVPERTSGLGLNNVKRRLALLYPDKFELNITDTPDQYQVNLKIQLDASA
ncbi:MAG: sensor histidine kinase [Rhodothermales bacterium]